MIGAYRRHGRHLFDEKDLKKLGDLTAFVHIGFGFVIESCEDLTDWYVAFLKLCDLVKLRSGDRKVCLRIVLQRCSPEFWI
jgi:hypothetical protein